MTAEPAASGIQVSRLTLGYAGANVLESLSLLIPRGKITVLAGPNGCGKSTLLRAIRRLHKPSGGSIRLDHIDIGRLGGRDLARRIGLLAQTPTAPDDMTVEELVRLGRYPHQSMMQPWSPEDARALEAAMAGTGVAHLRQRRVGSLSGGQLQRVWIAMVLAQETEVICLDEPVNHLDMSHQLECLELIARLNSEHGRTIVLVLHDLNLAARYADLLVFLKDGAVQANGSPEALMNAELIGRVFGIDCHVITDPVHQRPLCIPIRATKAAEQHG